MDTRLLPARLSVHFDDCGTGDAVSTVTAKRCNLVELSMTAGVKTNFGVLLRFSVTGNSNLQRYYLTEKSFLPYTSAGGA